MGAVDLSLDIFFIHTNASKKIYQDLSKDHSAFDPPIWAGMLANHCRNKNYKTEILDCEVKRLDFEQSAKEIHSKQLKKREACGKCLRKLNKTNRIQKKI